MNKARPEKFKHYPLLICVALVLANVLLFWPVLNHGFINLDDDLYVIENAPVRAGLTMKGVVWAFTSMHASNWHPLTWISHMLDVQLFGLNPGGHHAVNLFLHLVNSVLLFLICFKMTRNLWKCAFVAAIFSVHPLHVESVAWISERKDVLSAFFFLLTLGAYIYYVEKPGWQKYTAALVFFLLGLLSKPMLVTLPFVLLLLDFWPLGRFAVVSADTPRSKSKKKSPEPKAPAEPKKITYSWQALPQLVREKVPFFILASLSCVLTYIAQQKGGAITSTRVVSLAARVENALTSYIGYLGKWLWPQDLAILYPFQMNIPLWQYGGAALLLILITLLAIFSIRRCPYILTGWLWYLGTLVPVIGLVQVGSQSMADRYMYLPMIGLLLIPAWGIPHLLGNWRRGFPAMVLATSVALLLLGMVSRSQILVWQNSLALFSHAVQKTAANYLAQNNLGMALEEVGRIDQAALHYAEAIKIDPHLPPAYNNMGNIYMKQGAPDRAISCYRQALEENPEYAGAHYNLGIALASRGDFEGAVKQFHQALIIRPQYKEAHYNWGTILLSQKRFDESALHFEEALRIDSNYGPAHNNLGSALLMLGKIDEAINHFQRALLLEPGEPTATANLQDAIRLKLRLEVKARQ